MAESDNIKKIQMSELQSNLELNKLLLKYISQEYAQNDTAVIANLLDVSKKIILPEDKLEDLIKVALNDPNVKVEINTTKKQQSCNCCGKCRMNLHLFANIISIMVDGRSLRTVQPYVTEFLEDSGLYYTIDKDRKFNIHSEIGEDKSEYYIIHDGNLINCSQAVIDYSAIKNRIYVFNQYTEEDSEGNSIDKYITYVAEDKDSIANFGVKDYVLSVNDLRNIETAEKYANKELLKLSQPNINITIKVVINDELDIFDIEVGDYIYIESDLLNINQKIRVLEYTANIKENTVDIVLGNTIYRDNTVINYKY